MKSSRRQFIKTGMAAGAALAAGLPEPGHSIENEKEHKPLSVLVLGGTEIGRAHV